MDRLVNWFWNLLESVLLICIRLLEKIIRRQIPEKTRQILLQFVKFGVVGVSNSLVNYVSYVTSLLLFRRIRWFGNTDYLAAQIIAFVLSVLWSYYWNHRYVFVEGGQNTSWVVTLATTFAAYSFTGLLLSEGLLLLWVRVVGLSEFAAPILNILICLPINFLMNRFWAFQ